MSQVCVWYWAGAAWSRDRGGDELPFPPPVHLHPSNSQLSLMVPSFPLRLEGLLCSVLFLTYADILEQLFTAAISGVRLSLSWI